MHKTVHSCYVIGDPIAHSRSPIIHAHFADICKINNINNIKIKDFDYQRMHINQEGHAFEDFIHHFFQQEDALGLNITLPFKFRAFELAAHASPSAMLAHSANTLSLKAGKIYAHNTDGIGLVSDLRAKNVPLQGRNILIIGAGGATFGVLDALIQAGAAHIYIANRSIDKAQSLLQSYQKRYHDWQSTHPNIIDTNDEFNIYKNVEIISFEQIQEISKMNRAISLLINATPLGLVKQNSEIKEIKEIKNIKTSDPSEATCILENIFTTCDFNFFSDDAHIYEMAYGLEKTIFSDLANRLNLNYNQGLGMLIQQAKASFLHWQGFDEETTQHFELALSKNPLLF